MTILYSDLVVGTVYYGVTSEGSPYYFKYLGSGEWSTGTAEASTAAKHTAPYKPNTNTITAFKKVDSGASNPVKPKQNTTSVKYKIINHISNEPLYRCIPN